LTWARRVNTMARVSVPVDAMVREASSLARQGRVKEAIDAYVSLLRQSPHLPNSWYNLAVQQARAGAPREALASYQQALDHGIKQPEEVYLNRGVIFSDHLREYAAAEQELARALALNPSYLPALLNLGNLHEDLGHREAASSAYERALAVAPGSLVALARYANLTAGAALTAGSALNAPLIERLQHALASPGADAAERAALGFALGRLLDDAGRYSTAFEAYSSANRASRESARPGAGIYDRAFEERFIDRIIAAFPAASRPVAAKTTRPAPIFICGMFRSGSTLMEQVLARHARVTAGGEFDFIPRAAGEMLAPFPDSMVSAPVQRLAAVAAGYLDKLAELFPTAEFVTDKRPDNFVFIGLIKTLFPDAKIVHTTRNPLDNCLSIFFLHLDHRMSYALDPLDAGHHYAQYRRLMSHWKKLYGPDIVDVDYDEFVREPKLIGHRLFAALGLDWDDRHLLPPAPGEAIKTASVWQVREPIYQRSSGRARHYAAELRGLRDYLAELEGG
jgi:tetratricopeptide (TPR) repeat protein